jgi:hypothetical protein
MRRIVPGHPGAVDGHIDSILDMVWHPLVPYHDGSEEDGHYGLEVMQERARMIHGELQVTNLPSGGTGVRIEIPYKSRWGR